jgi:hypothetical protein
VHLGPARAPWVFSNIDRHVNLFPKIPLVFISDHEPHLKKAARFGVETYLYQPTQATDEIFSTTSHDNSFRHDFWRTSIERLIAIQQYQVNAIEEKMLHIESDVMLMPNFPWEKINLFNKLAWLSANSSSDCAALLYTPSIEAMNWLIEKLKVEITLHADTTDMTLLYAIRKKFPGAVNLFPSSSHSIADDLLRNDQERFFENTNLTSYFGGIFDALTMGMWLTGQNPRNQGGKVIRYEKYFTIDNDLNSDTFTFDEGYLSIGTQPRETVFNLHVHSKNPRLLSPRWRSELSKLISESKTLSGKRKFSISGFLGSQYDIFVSVNRKVVVYGLILLKIDKLVSRIRPALKKGFRITRKVSKGSNDSIY